MVLSQQLTELHAWLQLPLLQAPSRSPSLSHSIIHSTHLKGSPFPSFPSRHSKTLPATANCQIRSGNPWQHGMGEVNCELHSTPPSIYLFIDPLLTSSPPSAYMLWSYKEPVKVQSKWQYTHHPLAPCLPLSSMQIAMPPSCDFWTLAPPP